MRIQIASDLHLEFNSNRELLTKYPLNPVGDILVLAGDICCFSKPQYLKPFLELWKQQFKKIIYVPGNHEFYRGSFNLNYHKFIREEDNVIFLNNNTVIIDDIRFICSTLWSGISQDSTQCISDYFVINGFSKRVENQAHAESLSFIREELEKPFNKTVVVTHHLPLKQCIDDKFKDSPYNDAFCSHQPYLFSKNLNLWVHGHSHCFQSFDFNDVIVTRNPFGYTSEVSTFKNDYVIEL
jgi:predicted phosphodiesterase